MARRKTSRRRRKGRRRGTQRARDNALRALKIVARTALLTALPFWLLVRASVAAHAYAGAQAWIAVCIGMICATAGLTLWAGLLWQRLTGRDRFRVIASRLALPVVLLFSTYSLVWLSTLNAKSPSIRSLYSELHPSLRLAIGTVVLADPRIVITDIARTKQDYRRMGASPRERSYHYVQSDGWVYAVDLRTHGRSAFRNHVNHGYFRLMGFNVLRHGAGSGDHLHVSLPRRG